MITTKENIKFITTIVKVEEFVVKVVILNKYTNIVTFA